MKKFLLVFLLSILFLYGCTQESEKVTKQPNTSNEINEETLDSAKYENFRILEIESGNITIGPPVTDPEASYPTYEVFIEGNTKVEGEKKALNELKEGDNVNIWIKREGSDKEIADKIVVIK